jgi:hypothetical protein
MSRLPATAFALVLFVVPLLTMPVPAVAVTGLVGSLLAAVAIGALWRRLATAAACVFLADYAAALWMARGPVNVAGAAGFGLALLLLLEAVDLAGRIRGAAVDAPVVRSHLGPWIGLGVGAFAAAALAMALASSLATTLPPVVSPLLAVAGALGTALILAVVIRRSGKTAKIGEDRDASREGPAR